MKEGYVLYFIFIQSNNLFEDIEKLSRHSEYKKVGDFCMAYINEIKNSKSTTDVRDNIIQILGEEPTVMVINAREADAAWYMDSKDSEWLKEYI